MVAKWATKMVVEGSRPFALVDDPPFLNLLQKIGDLA